MKEALLISDLEETFTTPRKYELKLNSAKCTFGIRSGKFLGYLVTERGIEVNPEKIQVIQQMPAPTSLREVQRLAGRITVLSQFISRSAEKSLLVFRVLHKVSRFQWDEHYEQTFRDIKKYLIMLPVLAKPLSGERL